MGMEGTRHKSPFLLSQGILANPWGTGVRHRIYTGSCHPGLPVGLEPNTSYLEA